MTKSRSCHLELRGVVFGGADDPVHPRWDLITAPSCISVLQPHKRPRVTPSHPFYRCRPHPSRLWRRRLLILQHHQRGRDGGKEGGKLEEISRHETKGENLRSTITCTMMLFCCTSRLVTDWPLTTGRRCSFHLTHSAGLSEEPEEFYGF